ncbi:MAG TPA: tetratricopeptide repeat protein, partial [Planctomycetota bacterium]|nr:tetratricopeptide repeat protein [Planctomycetota bacterium]
MRVTSAILALIPALSVPSARAQEPPAPARFRVSVEQLDGETWCSISAQDASLQELMGDLARRAGLQLEGFERVSRTALVSAEIRHRPLREALGFVLGSVGLRVDPRVGTLVIRSGLHDQAGPGELREEALAAYLGALRSFPDHPAAAEAELSQARIEEQRGNLAAARGHYESLVADHPASELVPSALFDCGELLASQREWQAASQKYADLLRLDREHGLENAARIALARCTLELGDAQRALHMIDALDTLQPLTPREDGSARAHIRARAQLVLGLPHRALEALDALQSGPRAAESMRETLEVRALALEAVGEPAAAGRAWIACAERRSGSAQIAAWREACRLALAAGDELGALFVAGLGRRAGAGAEFTAIEREARTRLGLEEADLAGATPLQRLERAERLLQSGCAPQARRALEALAPSRGSFDEAAA